MNQRVVVFFATYVFAFAGAGLAQVDLKTGSIYGRVADQSDNPLPGVDILLESDVQTAQNAMAGSAGSFRFTQLPPGNYTVTFSLQGFTKVRQENLQVSVGSQVQLKVVLRPSLTEELTVISEAPLMDFRKTGSFEVYDREYLNQVPTARDPWTIIDQTPGVQTNRNEMSQQGVQSQFAARGSEGAGWNYDGMNFTDPMAPGASAVYYDFDSLEEIQISTTGGTSVNMVTKRGGNKWTGNVSYYFSDHNLQSHNTPEELIAAGLENQSNRLDRITEYGFDLGGPIFKDKLFVWGAYRKNDIDIFTITNQPDSTDLEIWNLKSNFNWTSHDESQFSYYLGNKIKLGRGFDPSIQAPETLWDQEGTDTILPGMFSGQHMWVPNDRIVLTVRYSYLGFGFQLVPRGGKAVPMIFLSAIPHYEDTGILNDPIDRPTHDLSVDANYFKEGWLGGDHEFKFGFDYRTTTAHTFSSYGNGVLLWDYYQTVPRDSLTSGLAIAQHYRDLKIKTDAAVFAMNDTYRNKKLTINLGANFSHSTGKNLPASIPAVPGFETFVGPFEYPGEDPGISFNTVSPQIGATYDVTGDGTNLIRGNFGRYYDTFGSTLLTYSNPAATYNGAFFNYTNLNGDRTITPNEITGGPYYYGGMDSPDFNLEDFLAKKIYDENLKPGWSNELILGYEREITPNFSAAITYTHREYGDLIQALPFGVTAADYVPGGTFTASTPLGTFSVPYFILGFDHDGTAILKNIQDYKQSYNGVDLVIRKRMSNDFMLNGSLVLQRQKAHYAGGDSSGFTIPGGVTGLNQFLPFDPGLLPFENGHPFTGGSRIYSEWELKLNGVYQLPWGMNFGASVKYRQGHPFLIAATIQGDESLSEFRGALARLILVEPYGSRRYDNIFNLDIQFEKDFDLRDRGHLVLIATLFNATNENTVFRRNGSVITDTFNAIQEHVAPRSLRLGVRYSF